jgi:hypothetical protein
MIDPTEVRALFDRAVSLSAAARSTLLDSACRDNPALRAEVDRLLAAHDRMGSVTNTRDREETSGQATRRPGAREPHRHLLRVAPSFAHRHGATV